MRPRLRCYPGGYYVPEGWKPVVLPALEALEAMGAEVYACKEQYGTIRFTVRDPDDAARAIVSRVSELVNWMCEDCGAQGVLMASSNGHLKTCCAKHPPEPFHRERSRDNFWEM